MYVTFQVLFADGVVSCNTGSSSGIGSHNSRDPSPQRGGSAVSMAQGSEAATAKKGKNIFSKSGWNASYRAMQGINWSIECE